MRHRITSQKVMTLPLGISFQKVGNSFNREYNHASRSRFVARFIQLSGPEGVLSAPSGIKVGALDSWRDSESAVISPGLAKEACRETM